jgi:hypothetical protein
LLRKAARSVEKNAPRFLDHPHCFTASDCENDFLKLSGYA